MFDSVVKIPVNSSTSHNSVPALVPGSGSSLQLQDNAVSVRQQMMA